MLTPPPFAALLLAGGYSRRMGRDKARLEWQDRPLWQRQMETLTQLGASHCMIACREEQRLHDTADLPALEWLFDPVDDPHGPLGAIERALRLTALPLIVLAVDMPFMTTGFLQHELCSEIAADSGYFFTSTHGSEPMAACYVPAMLPVMEKRLAHGERSLQGLIDECVTLDLARVRPLRADELPLFANLNTPGEWEHCQPPNTA